MVMKQSKFNTEASHLTHIIGQETEDYYPVFLQCLCPIYSVSANPAKRFTVQYTDRKRLFVVNKHDFSILYLWPNWHYATKWCVSLTFFQSKCLC